MEDSDLKVYVAFGCAVGIFFWLFIFSLIYLDHVGKMRWQRKNTEIYKKECERLREDIRRLKEASKKQ